MHNYGHQDLSACLKDRKIVFVGDSITRQVFWATSRKLGIQDPSGEDRHTDHEIVLQGVTVSFIWDPFLNSSGLHRELTAASVSLESTSSAGTTSLMLIGGGLWHARYLREQYLRHFEYSLEDITETIALQEKLSEKHYARSVDRFFSAESLVIFAPVLVPDSRLLTPLRAETMTTNAIDSMNYLLRQFSEKVEIPVIWSYNSMTAGQERAFQSDGLHVTETFASTMADVFLNVRCNLALRQSQDKAYPLDRTCCNRYDPPHWTQALILSVLIGLAPFLFLVKSTGVKRHSFFPSRKITHAIMVLALAVSYCYCADRTHLFDKEQKQYSSTEFLGLCTGVLALGILSIRPSMAVSRENAEAQRLQARDEPFLSRNQTDEWKGWMQCVILIYHYTGASKVLGVYQMIRLLVAAYLFLSGFGHTIFFCKWENYSLRRGAMVLIRLNMLSCILPYVMGTDYLFYYFAPLISFWYAVIHCTMAAGHSRNSSSTFIISKLLVSAALVTGLIRSPGLFEMLFYLLKKSCNIHWDVTEWRFRLQLDCYIVYIGMLCALVFMRTTAALQSNSYAQSGFDMFVQRYFNSMRFGLGAVSILVHPLFFILAQKASTKQEYNSWVPYVSFIPILAFVVLRNFSRHTRNFYSSIFAWIGRHSLETFTLQFHIWLAADTKGLLALGIFDSLTRDAPGGRTLDRLILTVIFLWVCWHVATATQTLTSWLIDPREGREGLEADGEICRVEMGLQRTKTEKEVNEGEAVVSFSKKVGSAASKVAKKLESIIIGHLEVRLVIIVGLLWFLNVTHVR